MARFILPLPAFNAAHATCAASSTGAPLLLNKARAARSFSVSCMFMVTSLSESVSQAHKLFYFQKIEKRGTAFRCSSQRKRIVVYKCISYNVSTDSEGVYIDM